jgi:hypothetical protein
MFQLRAGSISISAKFSTIRVVAFPVESLISIGLFPVRGVGEIVGVSFLFLGPRKNSPSAPFLFPLFGNRTVFPQCWKFLSKGRLREYKQRRVFFTRKVGEDYIPET